MDTLQFLRNRRNDLSQKAERVFKLWLVGSGCMADVFKAMTDLASFDTQVRNFCSGLNTEQ